MTHAGTRRRRPGAVALLLAAGVIGGGLLVAAVPLFWVMTYLGWVGSLATAGLIAAACLL